MEKDFQKINRVLVETIRTAIAYLAHHDGCYKKYCLQTSAWDAVEKLKKMMPSLSEPFLTPAKDCLRKCVEAMEQMPEINISYEEFPVAAESLTKLAEKLDRILKSNSSLKSSISEKDLASERLFVNLAKVASQAK